MNILVTLLLPAALTFVLALALHLFAKEKAERFALLPVAVSLLVCWVFIVRPGWAPLDDVRRIIHIAVGATLLGLALDVFRPHRFIAAVLAAAFILVCAFASVTGTLTPPGMVTAMNLMLTGAVAAVAFLTLMRFDAMCEHPLSLVIQLALVACGLWVLSAIGRDVELARLALVLAAALAGYLVFVMITGARIGGGFVLVTGAPMLAFVWALVQRHPEMRLALLCLPLVLFAEATARRVPLPAARISTLLYPLILAGLVSLPLVLAALISFVTTKA